MKYFFLIRFANFDIRETRKVAKRTQTEKEEEKTFRRSFLLGWGETFQEIEGSETSE